MASQVAEPPSPMELGAAPAPTAERDALRERFQSVMRDAARGSLAHSAVHDLASPVAVAVATLELAALRIEDSHSARSLVDRALIAASRVADQLRSLQVVLARTDGIHPLAPALDEAAGFGFDVRLRGDSTPFVRASPDHLVRLLAGMSGSVRGRGARVELVVTDAEFHTEVDLPLPPPDLLPGPHVCLRTILPEILGSVAKHDLSALANLCGGAAYVAEHPSGGVVVTVWLPRAAASTSPERVVETPAPAVGARCMVINDEPMLLATLESLLLHFGFRVDAFLDGAQAVDRFRTEPDAYDVVLTDLRMPGMRGMECIAAIRRVRPSFPVGIATGARSEAETGDVPVLELPADLKDLREFVHALLRPPP